jgi:hypothetical protein
MRLEVSPRRLVEVAETAPSYYEDLVLIDPARPNKVRAVLNVVGPLRRLQRLLHDRVLSPARRPTKYSHGGIPGRNIRTNAAPHLESTYVYTTDIADFYPSVHYTAVYKLFAGEFACSPDVARICTKLCTRDFHMPLGLITSPILADCLMERADRRIGRMCERSGLIYTRYVDDLTISSAYPVESGSYPKLISKILCDYGFKTNPTKEDMGRLSEGKRITKLCVKRGRLDVSPEYLASIRSQLENAAVLARGGDLDEPYYTPAQIHGRIQFVVWVNLGRRRELMRAYRSVDWEAVEREALARGLVQVRKRLVKKLHFERSDFEGQVSVETGNCHVPNPYGSGRA